MKKKILITTPLYYASGNLHIGHLYATNFAWVLRNMFRLFGHDAKLLSGIDEHGTKIQMKAAENKMQPKVFVDMINEKFLNLWKTYKLDLDFYERTTNEGHKQTVLDIFNKMLDHKDIELKKYSAWYSTSDEEFVTLTNAIKEGDDYFHPVSHCKLIKLEEKNYFFLMQKYETWLKEFLKTENLVFPQKVINELNGSFLDKGLENLSVTRENIEWGIKTLTKEKQTIYVWLDALFGYLTGLGYGTKGNKNYIDYWEKTSQRIHVLGKEISRFHLIYFPIFLKSINLPLPTNFLVHGWLLSKNMKMSKSIGNVIDPYELLEKFDVEMVKYYFAAKIDYRTDGNVDQDLIRETVNNELINNYGNLISRTLKMISNTFTNGVKYKKIKDEKYQEIETEINNLPKQIERFLNEFRLDQIFTKINDFSTKMNVFIDYTKPWTLTNEPKKLEPILNLLLNGIYAISYFLKAVMPVKIADVENALKIKLELTKISDLKKFDSIIPEQNFMLWKRLNK
ncbi:Methionine--tRNA ligase [Mycoplasmopsis californica]|uniref:Methionine--tRNA ligase n=1 Tax=Mycoplasmopsis equigenitalium TaxID=114883 RepID=A0ABY5J1G0_9BACT|nr:methionine--tRNA ligase [Mycoplasmopsis equigenitalium]UUD36825.1 methionine--tRNA ligase [Mycoplasmopsis equigenitalium]VEU69878.1 Methionine--tRNA ligase [Mycoplasmopsis californica]